VSAVKSEKRERSERVSRLREKSCQPTTTTGSLGFLEPETMKIHKKDENRRLRKWFYSRLTKNQETTSLTSNKEQSRKKEKRSWLIRKKRRTTSLKDPYNEELNWSRKKNIIKIKRGGWGGGERCDTESKTLLYRKSSTDELHRYVPRVTGSRKRLSMHKQSE